MAVEQNKLTHFRTSVSNTDYLACLCPRSMCSMMESRLRVLGACLMYFSISWTTTSFPTSHKCYKDFRFPLRGQDFLSLCDLRSPCSWYLRKVKKRPPVPWPIHLLYNLIIPQTVLTFHFGYVNRKNRYKTNHNWYQKLKDKMEWYLLLKIKFWSMSSFVLHFNSPWVPYPRRSQATSGLKSIFLLRNSDKWFEIYHKDIYLV